MTSSPTIVAVTAVLGAIPVAVILQRLGLPDWAALLGSPFLALLLALIYTQYVDSRG